MQFRKVSQDGVSFRKKNFLTINKAAIPTNTEKATKIGLRQGLQVGRKLSSAEMASTVS